MNKPNTIAIDFAKKIFQVCVVSPNCNVIKEKRLSRIKLTEFIVKQEKSVVVKIDLPVKIDIAYGVSC